MKSIIVSILSLSFLAACATGANEPLAFSSQSGKPERIFSDRSVKEVKNRIVDVCVNGGFQVTDSGGALLSCWKTMEGGSAVLAQVLIGNSYSSPPTQHVQFAVTERNESVVVTSTSQWIETQMAFGQIKRQELNSNKHLNDVYRWLQNL